MYTNLRLSGILFLLLLTNLYFKVILNNFKIVISFILFILSQNIVSSLSFQFSVEKFFLFFIFDIFTDKIRKLKLFDCFFSKLILVRN